jgi:hypothetical protein
MGRVKLEFSKRDWARESWDKRRINYLSPGTGNYFSVAKFIVPEREI